MKRLLALVVLLGVMLCASSVSAEVKQGTVTLSPFIGGYTFDGAQHLETQPVYGLRVGYNFTGNWGAELVFDYVHTAYTKGQIPLFGQEEVNAFKYRLDGLYHFSPEKKLVPFLVAGFGATTIDKPQGGNFINYHQTIHRNGTVGLFNCGGGLKYFLTEDLALRGDVRYLLTFDRLNSNLEYTVGLSYAFGGKKPAPPPPAVVPPVEPPPVAPPKTEKVCITLMIEFDFDRADIKPRYHEQIKQVADFLATYPTTSAVIEGHTDNVGTSEYNEKLSLRRAESVRRYLVEKFGVNPARLKAVGYGFSRPVADNSTAEGRQKNRRIDAVIDCVVTVDGQVISPMPEKVCISLNIEFDTDRAEIKTKYHDTIKRVAQFLVMYPDTNAVIEGHTDNVGSADYNLKLSEKRADSVRNYLIEKFGISPARLASKGFGLTRPVADNRTPEGRAKNRRIDAVIDCVVKK